ncbi:hypothetical protein NEIPOLOT_00325 [Neisseria polysaccharea ATCC 43768]|nr:hypothetical protein NEIPOLOT_00325 [Neisseria polysaccharea ATCC 43768]
MLGHTPLPVSPCFCDSGVCSTANNHKGRRCLFFRSKPWLKRQTLSWWAAAL